MIHPDEEFTIEKQCIFNGRRYKARDNGSVMRLSEKGKRKTVNDDIWTFGKTDSAGYPAIAGVRIHLIIAEAFLGTKPEGLVIDHKDTIKVNNRPSNLHYVTRFENVANNQYTRQKLEHVTGMKLEEILDNPDILHSLKLPKNWSWLTAGISEKEVENMRRHIVEQANKPVKNKSIYIEDNKTSNSKTAYAIQADGWFPAGFFPCCPQHENSSLEEYMENIIIGEPIFYHDGHEYITEAYELSEDKKIIAVKAKDNKAVKENILVTITYDSNYWFIHKCDRFFSEEGLEKYYSLALGREWLGGDTLDDGCM